MPDALEVDREYAIVLRLLGIEDVSHTPDARVVVREVESSELSDRCGNERLAFSRLGHVARHEPPLTARLLRESNGLLAFGSLGLPLGDHDRRASLSGGARDRPTDATRGARDQAGLVLQRCRQRATSCDRGSCATVRPSPPSTLSV